MKLWQNIVVWFIWSCATFLAFVMPFYKLFDKLIIKHYETTRARWSFAIAFVLVIAVLILVKLIKAWYNRKLQSISVADELGIVGTTPIIIKRVLLLLQVAIPLIAASFFFYGLSFIEIPSYKIFIDFNWWFLGGFAVYVVHDYVKRYFFIHNQIEKAYKLDVAKAKYAERTFTITQE